ncbi:MAG: ACP S-malonyltransferase [Elusimicrobiota bacterium]|jgi:[acyl-carrier-protein] S-malonyltransferase
MESIAFIFPGQGSQTPGMGSAVAERYPEARRCFEEASELLGWDLLQACQQGPEERLRQTDVAQPALYVTGYAAATVLRSLAVEPGAVAGHSIGEYAALAFAGVFDFKEGLRLVRERGRLMQEAGQAHPGAMAAILGLAVEKLQACCEAARGEGICVPVNFNSPEQIVIAGEKSAVEKVSLLASEQGAKRVIALNVSGAFHSPLMTEAAQAMRFLLQKVAFRDAAVPLVMNADGQSHQRADEIRETLARQLDNAVQWVKTMETMRQEGNTRFVECGSGRVLSGLVKKFDRQLQAYSTETTEALAQAAEALGAARKGIP